jgi:Tfp pilus assembly protein FimT
VKNPNTKGFGLSQLLQVVAILAVLIALVTPAMAQQYSVSTLNTGTNVIGASSALTPTSAVVTTTKHDNVAYTVSFNLSGTGTGNVISTWAKGLNGVYESTPSITMTNAANGTNTVVGFGNTSVGAAGSLKLVSITNGNTPSTITNLTVKAGLKPNY